jgi:hypothetical protein
MRGELKSQVIRTKLEGRNLRALQTVTIIKNLPMRKDSGCLNVQPGILRLGW